MIVYIVLAILTFRIVIFSDILAILSATGLLSAI